jgi:uncharacterized repeat protein (TIGR01451 family)
MKHVTLGLLLALVLLGGMLAPVPARAHPAPLSALLINPAPKWGYKGCTSWCQTGWYASPAVADLNGDGKPEVIWSAYSIYVVDGAAGNSVWSVQSGHDRTGGGGDVGRTWPGIVVADIDNDRTLEVVTAHSGGWVGVYDGNGYFKPGWPQHPYTNELRSLAVDDLDGDSKMEIAVARASGGSYNQWTVLQSNGATRPGWPRLSSSEPGYGWGAYNENIGIGDIDGDGRGEIIGPSDVHYISAFNDDGSQIQANSRYTPAPKFWSQVGVHVDDFVDLRGYANCGTEHRPNFANSAPDLVDVNGDGTLEVVVVGNVHNCGTNPYTDLAYLPFIFNKDRSRWAAGAYDWTTVPPLGGTNGPPLSEDYNVIQNAVPNPALADLDGDGIKELLYPSYDGKLHAFWMDKTEHGSWPFNVTQLAGDWSFASEPIVADLDNDGKAEVIFGTWPRNGGGRVGKLVVTDWQGNLLQQLALPAPLGDDWNGVLGAPTIANIDADPELELVVGTVASGIVAYDLPGSTNARVLWGTGRGSFLRTGAIPRNPLRALFFATTPQPIPQPGDTVTLRLTLTNPTGGPLAPLQFTDTLPANLTYAGGLSASRGTANQSGGTITWNGTVPAGTPVTITFQAQISAAISGPTVIANNAQISGGLAMSLRVVLIVKGKGIWLPVVQR